MDIQLHNEGAHIGDGLYQVVLTVTDKDGDSTPASQTFQVATLAPPTPASPTFSTSRFPATRGAPVKPHIGSGASVQADLVAQSIVISGEVAGNVKASVKVDLHGQPTIGDVAQLDRAAIDGDEAMHDGQPESTAGGGVAGRDVGWLGPESAEGLVALG